MRQTLLPPPPPPPPPTTTTMKTTAKTNIYNTDQRSIYIFTSMIKKSIHLKKPKKQQPQNPTTTKN